ncbi:hypothetical protein, partial [Tropicimonas sp. IMCC6043]|uniref:hypothetical protein n=1 Tax=Tropicimonas sp. IMCC6043 TaxID=2510645 RepID=UPI001A932BA1
RFFFIASVMLGKAGCFGIVGAPLADTQTLSDHAQRRRFFRLSLSNPSNALLDTLSEERPNLFVAIHDTPHKGM